VDVMDTSMTFDMIWKRNAIQLFPWEGQTGCWAGCH